MLKNFYKQLIFSYVFITFHLFLYIYGTLFIIKIDHYINSSAILEIERAERS